MKLDADGFPIDETPRDATMPTATYDPAAEIADDADRAAQLRERNADFAPQSFAPGTVDGVPLPPKDTEHVAKLTTHDDGAGGLPLCSDCPAPRQATCLRDNIRRGFLECDRFHVEDIDAARAGDGTPDPVVKPKRTRKPKVAAPIPPAREDGTMRVIRLESENVKRLRAVVVEPGAGVVVVGGRNAQGKSSVLDSIEMALAGARSIPTEPIRHGEESARTVVDLDGLRVTRTYTAAGGSLRVERANGDRPGRPQEILDELAGRFTFDPLAFARSPQAAQVETLRQVTGLDTTDLDEARAKLYAERTEVGRKREAARARVTPIVGSMVEFSVRTILDQLQAAQKQQHAVEQHRMAVVRATNDRAAAARRIVALESELTELRSQVTQHDAVIAKPCAIEVPDVTALQSALACAEDTNMQARANAESAKHAGEADHYQAKYAKLTDEIDGIDKARAARVAGATMPIEGLTLDASCVRYRGVPLSQASQAEALRVSLAVGAALNPKVRVLLVRDASVLDAEQMALVRAWATERGYQVWLERVGSGDAGAVVIEDGRVVEPVAPAVDGGAA